MLLTESEDGPPRVKLADFGVSTFLGGPDLSTAQKQSRATGQAARSGSASAGRELPIEAALLDGEGDSNTLSVMSKPAAAAAEAAERDAALDEQDPPEGQPLTQTGILVGTPMYMAPELSEGSHLAQPPSDIFSLGIIAFELFSGEIPFRRPPVWARWRGTEQPAPSLATKRPELAAELVALVDSCLQLDPELRPTAATIAAALRGWPQPPTSP